MRLSDISVRRPVGVFMIVLAILALGFVSLQNLKVDLYPKIDVPIAVVATSYPGAGPKEIEKLISKPVESAVTSIEGVDTIQSRSQANSSLVILQFASGTNLDNALLEVREKVDQVKGMLPEDANDPSVLRFDPQQLPVMWLGLSGAEVDKLQQVAEDQIEPFLVRSEGVASVTIEGGKTREIQLELDRGKLAQYNITPQQVIQTLNSENRSSSGGIITKGTSELQIRIEGEFTSLRDIENTMLSLPKGGEIKVKDIATLNDTFKKVNSITRVNDKDALVLSVLKKSGGNTVEVADGVYETMEKLEKKLPENVELSVVFDTSTFIRDSINSVVKNMLIGGLLSVVVLFLFLRSVRSTLVIAVSIPIAVISAFTMMYFSGQTINILSMGGLALGIGMMVDSSIVILENIFRYRQDGATVKEAAIKGASELASAVIASTTTTLVVFLPIVFVEGLASDLFTPLALTVSFSLIASLVVSLTLIPVLSSKLLTKKIKPEEEQKGWFIAFFRWLDRRYQKTLDWVLGHRKTTVFATIVALVGSFSLAPMIGTEFIPAADQGQLSISIETPAGTNLEETEAIVNQVAKKIEPYQDDLQTNFLSIGTDTQSGLSAGANTATFQIQMIDKEERDMTTKQLIKQLSEDVEGIAGADITVAEMEGGFGTGSPISVNIFGPEYDVLEDLAEQVSWLVSEVDGVTNVVNSASEGRPEIQVQVDREIAAQYGLSYQQIMTEVELGFNGQVATRFRDAGEEYDVRVILPEDRRTNISDLSQLKIQTPTGDLIPLTTVAELKQVIGPVQITRENQQRQISITADLDGRDLGSVSTDLNAALAKMNFPEGYNYTMGGQAEDMAESFTNLALALLFSIFLVYVVMAVQFESLIQPFIIMFSMPTTLVGILIGLFVTGQPLSIPAFIGVIMLAGIVVNNAIVLVDYINILRDRGMNRTEAILTAGPHRLRPILMTTLTTVLGMVPLALGFGEGGESQIPMAVVIIFGLTASMCFTLLLIPVVYTYVEDFTKFVKRIFTRKKKVKEDIPA